MKNYIKKYAVLTMEYIKNIPNEIIRKKDLIIYILIFTTICFIYNLNNQTLNFLLKRGTILEYSQNTPQVIDKDSLKKELVTLGINYSFVGEIDNFKEKNYDSNNQLIQKKLIIGVPYLAKKDQEQLFNSISDYIFKNYKNTKLNEIKPINDSYYIPYRAFKIFFNIALISFIFWLFIEIIFFKKSINIKSILNKLNVFKNFEKKEFSYYIKKILFDETDENSEINYTKEIVSTIVFVLVAVIIIRSFIGELRWIPSGSMHPTILEKDRVFVEKLEYPKKEIKRGDILVFYPPQTELSNSIFAIFSRLTGIYCKDIAYIKRAIGLPGDKFEIKYDKKLNEYAVYINNEKLNEPYILTPNDWSSCENPEVKFCGPFTIPEDNYFMMGDNRGNSQDSRFWGFLPKERIIGRANFMFFPFGRINLLNDKYLELNQDKNKDSYTKKIFILNRY